MYCGAFVGMVFLKGDKMRYCIFTPTSSKTQIKYLFQAEGMKDSEIFKEIMCVLDFEEYQVKFTNTKPRATKHRIWYFDDDFIITP